MQHHEIADRVGLSMMDLERLVKGEATANVAKKLGVTMMDVQEFVRGKATLAMTQRLALKTMNAAQELAQTAGGAGVLIGFMMNM
jgi:hypothetical protein